MVALILMINILVVLSCSCTHSSKWEQNPDLTMPWCAPSLQSKSLIRNVSSFKDLNSPIGHHREEIWVNSKNKKIKVDYIAEKIEKYFQETIIFNHGVYTNIYTVHNGISKKMKKIPFKFYIVSIEPEFIIMTPFEFSKNPLNDIYDNNFIGTLWVGGLVTAITFPHDGRGMLWFTPDMKGEPRPVEEIGPGRYRVSANGAELELIAADGQVRVERLK